MTVLEYVPSLLLAALMTIAVAVTSWIIATVLGFGFALIQRNPVRGIRWANDFITTCVRGTPQLILVYLAYFGLGQLGFNIHPFTAAVIGLGVAEACFTAEVFRAGFTTVGHRRIEAAKSLGLTGPQIVFSVELPILLRFAVAPLLNSFVGLLKLSTLASAIGVPELLYQGGIVINRTYEIVQVSVLLITIYLLFTVPITRSVARIERRMRQSIA